MRNKYNTKQKELILSCLISNREKSITVNEISNYLNSKNTSVGITTIYRYLESLEKEGKIKKFNESITSKYQYIDKLNCQHHYHLKCNNCGKLIHLECDEINELNSHIIKEHGFKMDNNKTIIYGVCSECEVNDEKD